MPQRNYRDPLHNIISLDESVPEDRLIVDLIDSAEFQRLRRIKQLQSLDAKMGSDQTRTRFEALMIELERAATPTG